MMTATPVVATTTVAPTPEADPSALGRCFGGAPQPFEQAWQRAPLVGHDRSGAAFADLLDVAAVDELITTRALRHPAFRLVQEGETLPRAGFTSTRRWGATRYEGVLDPARAVAALADGATLVLQALHTYWVPLGRFCADLHAALGHPTQANAYLTPAAERGLGLHYDTHDVVVLQTAGHKRWEIFAPRFEAPLGTQHWSDVGGGEDLEDGDLTPVLETVLGPGDCLYLPRGFVHRVVSEDEASLHVTVGLHVQTWHHVLADMGYIVASVDNRGTPSPRGRAWRKVVYGSIGVLASREQAEAVRALVRVRPWLDPSRVGIWGWSGGGSATLNAMFRYPEVYQVGMSVAPVPDQRLYDTIYQERYMGLPQDNAAGYRDGSPITFADGLRGSLLLVHGSGDDNVHYQGSERLVNRMIQLGRRFDFMTYPDRSHCICEGDGTTLHIYSLLTRYLEEHLPAGGR